MLDFEKRKILWVYYTNEYAWNGDIVGYININNNKLLTKKQYDKMVEREAYEKWQNMNIEELTDFEDFENFWAYILNNSFENDFIPLVEIIIDENDDIEKYNSYIEMHWLEILALEHEVSIYQIAKKGGLSTSTLYSMIDRNTQLCDISAETLNKILKVLNMNIFEFMYKYDGRLF